MRRPLLLAALAGLALAGPAGLTLAAPAGAAETAAIVPTLNADGSGSLNVGSQTNPPGETWGWSVCAANGTGCVPFATGRTILTAGARPSSVFAASANDGPTGTSPIWGGNLALRSPPAVAGGVRANSLVTPVPAAWTGGWPSDSDQTQLAACVDAQGTMCTTLTDTHFHGGCPGGGAVIDPAFTGRYLRVADHVVGPNELTAAFAVTSPYGSQTWPADPRTAVAVVGVIAPLTGPPDAGCGVPFPGGGSPPATPNTPGPESPTPGNTPPTAAARTTPSATTPSATATLSAGGVATVHGIARCLVTLRATDGRAQVKVSREIHASQTATVRLSAAALRRLGSGRATFSVLVNGIRRTSRLIRVG